MSMSAHLPASLPISSSAVVVNGDDDLPTAEQVAAMSASAFKIYENRLRRMAKRQLLELHKIRRRDRLAHDYGHYNLVSRTGKVVATGRLLAMHAWLVRRR